MIYDLTDKLRFDQDPVLRIGEVKLTVRSDAEVVLSLVEALSDRGEAAGAREAARLLFSEADRKKLARLRLKMDDYLAVMKAAVQLAMGGDPGEETPPAGE